MNYYSFVMNPPDNTGWRCPSCNVTYAPWVRSCNCRAGSLGPVYSGTSTPPVTVWSSTTLNGTLTTTRGPHEPAG